VSRLSQNAWNRDAFTPYLGSSFAEVEQTVRKTIRDGAAHLKAGMTQMRIPEMTDGVRACRAIVPVLRCVSRRVIEGELAYAIATAPAA